MKFMALIIALAFLQYWGSAQPFHRDDWYRSLLRALSAWSLGAWVMLGASLLLPVLLLVLLLEVSGSWLFGLPVLIINVAVLLYSFGRGNFDALLGKYREYCRSGDFEAAYLFAIEELGSGSDGERPSGEEELHRWVKERLAYLGFERWFAVTFYFALFGAPGALAYRLLQLNAGGSGEPGSNPAQERLLFWVDWLPSRVLVFAFAVTGDWVGSRDQMKTALGDFRSSTARVLSDAVHAALGLKTSVFSANGDVEAWAQISDWEIGELRGLLTRSAIAWVVVLSLIVLLA